MQLAALWLVFLSHTTVNKEVKTGYLFVAEGTNVLSYRFKRSLILKELLFKMNI